MEPFRNIGAVRKRIGGRIVFCFVLLLLAPSDLLFGENIRGQVQNFIEIPEDYTTVRTETGLRGLTSLDIASGEFLRGFILEIGSPPSVLQFRQSFLLSLYGGVSPEPESGSESFNGRKILSLPFPTSRKTFVDLPIETFSGWDNSGPGSTRIDSPLSTAQFPLLLVIDPVMKGIPSSVGSARFEITVTPVLKNLGALQLEVPGNIDLENVYFLVDGRDIGDPAAKQYLKPGIHTLEVKSESYLPISRSIGIEQARTARLEISLQPSRSFVQFYAPEGATVFFDGDEIDIESEGRFETEPGDHVVLVRIGEYSVSKKISVQGGKTYKVSLFFDILIDDN